MARLLVAARPGRWRACHSFNILFGSCRGCAPGLVRRGVPYVASHLFRGSVSLSKIDADVLKVFVIRSGVERRPVRGRNDRRGILPGGRAEAAGESFREGIANRVLGTGVFPDCGSFEPGASRRILPGWFVHHYLSGEEWEFMGEVLVFVSAGADRRPVRLDLELSLDPSGRHC